MIWIAVIAAVGLMQAPVKGKLSPAAEAQWEQCAQLNPAESAIPAIIRTCTTLLANPDLDTRQTALIYFWRSQAKARSDDLAGADADLDRGLALPNVAADEQASLLIARATLREFQKRPREARAAYDRAIRIDPGNTDALFQRASLAASEKRWADARDDLTAADRTQLAPAFHARLHVLRAGVLEEMKDLPGARADLDRAIEVAPNDAHARYARAGYYSRQRKLEEALADHVKTTELAPRFAGGFNGVCWKLAADLKREFDRARTACDMALSLAPKDANILDSAGLVALQQKRWQDAWQHYDSAARLGPGSATYLYGRGIAALRTGRVAAGNADITAAVKAEPTIAATYAGYGQTP